MIWKRNIAKYVMFPNTNLPICTREWSTPTHLHSSTTVLSTLLACARWFHSTNHPQYCNWKSFTQQILNDDDAQALPHKASVMMLRRLNHTEIQCCYCTGCVVYTGWAMWMYGIHHTCWVAFPFRFCHTTAQKWWCAGFSSFSTQWSVMSLCWLSHTAAQ